ncbi:hypothetical protein ACIQI7_22475 [Kitasatospora sp. NPDC092039]|uniref:hypothetical protein n=1 Tax=Kitasatospora sp. NPDC092039 TaxID=3364086 RepID=UPI00382BE004
MQYVRAPFLTLPGDSPIILLVGSATGRPHWQRHAFRLLADNGFAGTVLDPYVPGDTELPWRTGWLARAEEAADVLLCWRPLGPWPVTRAHRTHVVDRRRPAIVVGCPADAGWQEATRRCLAADVPDLPVHSTLHATVEAILRLLEQPVAHTRRRP